MRSASPSGGFSPDSRLLTCPQIEPDWLGYMRFLPAHMTAGFAVFAPGPVLEGKARTRVDCTGQPTTFAKSLRATLHPFNSDDKFSQRFPRLDRLSPTHPQPSAADTIFSWVTPFAGRTWALLLGSLVAVGIIMAWLESEVNHEDFPGTSNVHRLIHVWNGCYLSIAGFTSKTEEFSPKTIPGRVLGVLNSFAVWLALAAYIGAVQRVPGSRRVWVEVFCAFHLDGCAQRRTAD